MRMQGGYKGKILQVNLSAGKMTRQSIDMEQAMLLIGGRGLGTKFLWDRTKPGLDSLDECSPLYFLTGPLTGLAPGGAQTCLVFKSPGTEVTLGHAVVGANWGPELKLAGYDGLTVEGQSETPVYLLIHDEKAELRDARHLWGKGTMETEVKLKEELRDPFLRVLCIGPAGENLVRFACVQTEYFHAAARGGAGCLMGSKKLKAIAVRGTGTISVAKPQEFDHLWALTHANLQEARTRLARGYSLARWGSTISSIGHSDVSELDVKNYREAYHSDIDKIGGLEFERRCLVNVRSCFSCPIACMHVGVVRSGRFAGAIANPDFDSTGTIGAGCLVTDHDSLVYLNSLADNLGVDAASIGNVTSFAMECYEKGILKRADLDGIDLKWGNVPAMISLWQKIVHRQGIGELLAQGVKKASQEIGQGSEKFAMHCKGLEFAGYAPQAHHDRGLQYAVGDRGGCHHYGLTIAEQNQRALADSLCVCSWHMGVFISYDLYLKLLNAATGWDFAESDWNLVAERILLLGRAYNIREGMVPLRDDILPERVHSEPLTQGPKKGAIYPREEFEKDRAQWYKERGCDSAGIPTEERLRQLQLEFVLPELHRARGSAH